MHVAIERNSWRLPQDDVVQVVNPKTKLKDAPDELAYAGLSDGQYWRSVILALLVIALVIAGIATAICSYGFVDELLCLRGTPLRLEDILNTTSVFPTRLPSTWVSFDAFVYQNDIGDLVWYNATSNAVATLISNYTLNQINVKEYKCSHNLKYILLESNINRVFKNAYTSHVTIYTVKNGHQTKLHLNETEVNVLELQSASWAGRTNNIIFVKDNDIYVKFETNPNYVRLTDTGIPGTIYNGIPDWLYQEEIFVNSESAYWPSADGRFLLYATFNDSQVPTLDYPWIDDDLRRNDRLQVAPMRSVRYPTPGTNIPKVELWLVDIRAGNVSRTPIKLKPPRQLLGENYYLASAGWINQTNERCSAVWMSRTYNFSVVNYYEAPLWNSFDEQSHVETAEAPYAMWLEVQPHPVFAADGQSYLLLAPVQDRNHCFTQIKHVTQADKHVRVISHGPEVLRILAWDTVNHLVYYAAVDEDNTGEQHLYVVNDQTTGDIIRPQTKCITCHMRFLPRYENCTHFTAYFALNNPTTAIKKYALQCESLEVATAAIHIVTDHSVHQSLYTGEDKRHQLRKYALPKMLFEQVKLKNNYVARVQLSMPPSWRPELRDAAFPVIIQVDGKPNSQLVSTEWKTDWSLYMSGSKSVVYVKIDVRGSKGQISRELYKNLGEHEINDQISVIRELLKRHKYLDSHRIGVWGWGYGGYATILLMNSHFQTFNCGIAVAPIADWRFYNSAFTEKIFGLKSNANQEGYVHPELKAKSAFIRSDSTFYLIQGLADQSVPFQHGFMWANALTESNKLFRHQVYANEGFALENVQFHMYRSMENHFTQCLRLEGDD